MKSPSDINTSWGQDIIRPTLEGLVIGSGTSATVRLLQSQVERQHAEVFLKDGFIVVRDCGTGSGTWVNGTRVRENRLQAGDRVSFGPVTYECWGNHLRLQSEPNGVLLEAENIGVARGGSQILSNITLRILPNQFVGILGLSGAGKTTLIKCLAGFYTPTSGELRFDGKAPSDLMERDRTTVGYVPQDDLIYTLLTGWENLHYGLQLRVGRELTKTEQTEVIAYTLRRVNLEKKANRCAATLSGGERKRLNVALELLSRPRLLFLDEPTSGLDPASETRLMKALQRLAGTGTTVICSTHVLENLGLFDQVIAIANHTAVYAGRPDEILPFFETTRYPELYIKLEDYKPSDSPDGRKASISSTSPAAPDLKAKRRKLPPIPKREARNTVLSQVGILFFRGAAMIWKDKRLLALLLGQPVLIGLLINLSQLKPNGVDPIFMFGVVTSIWLGLNNTAREVVRERTIYVRERLIGITMEGYLGAKCLLYGLIGLVQSMLLVFVIRFLNVWFFLHRGEAEDLIAWSPVFILFILWVTYLSAMLLGLVISTVANTQEESVAWLPVVILPQILLTSVVTGLTAGRDGSLGPLSLLVRNTGEASRNSLEWILEVLSLFTYSRPAMTLLKHRNAVDIVDWLYFLLVPLVTCTVLAFLFRRQERLWLQRV